MKTFCTQIFSAAAAVLLSSCSLAERENWSASTRAAPELGIILPVSTSSAARDAADGATLAAEEFNASSKTEIAVSVEDNSAGANATLAAVEKLSRKNVRLFCVGFDPEILPCHKLLSNINGGFFDFLIEYPPAVLLGKNAARIYFNGAQQADKLAAHFAKTAPAKNAEIAIISEDSPYGKSLGDYFNFTLATSERKIIRDFFAKGETRFDIYARHITARNPAAVFYVGTGGEFSALKTALARAGFTGRLYKNRGFFDVQPTHASAAKPALRTTTISAPFEIASARTREGRSFAASFEKRFGRPPSVYAAFGYDGAKALIAAAARNNFDISKLSSEFKNTRTDAATSTLVFDSSGDCTALLNITSVPAK